MSSNFILEMKGIVKVFPLAENPVIANDHVDFSIKKGEIHALVGENGAGKTTLMNILYGMYTQDEGTIILDGMNINIEDPKKAISYGIGMVHQHFVLIPSFTVAENLIFGYEPHKGLFVDLNKARQLASEISQKYGLEVDPDKKIQECSLSTQQRVEILKILLRGASILIFDEPTAVLTPQETKELFKAFRELAQDGKTIIFITHKLREVMAVAERVTVMQKGQVRGVVNVKDTSVEELARLMVGRDVSFTRRRIKRVSDSDKILEVDNLSCLDDRGLLALKDVSFHVKAGEILGVAGVGGNGQNELVECLTGLRETINGDIIYKGRKIIEFSAVKIRNLGVGHIPGQRYTRGICKESNVLKNLIMGAHKKHPLSKSIFLNLKQIDKYTEDLIKNYSIKTSSKDAPIMNLSGGNVQKCVVAREFTLARDLIIAEEPTRGVDIGAIEFIHTQLLKKCEEGNAIIMVSTDLDEIIALSSRIIVMYNGCIIGEVSPDITFLEEKVGLLMAGIA